MTENTLILDHVSNSSLDTHWSEEQDGLKLDLACGANLRAGYVGVDNMPLEELASLTNGFQIYRERGREFDEYPPEYEGYIEANLLEFPWPFEDSSVAATYSSHFVEHIPHQVPGSDLTVDGWWLFFAELYRVLEDGGIAEFIHPFSRSDRAFWDPTHTRFIHYQTWFYLNREHRIQLGVNHYVPEINFEVLNIQSMHEPRELEGRSQDVVGFARQFYWNVTDDLFVVLRAIK